MPRRTRITKRPVTPDAKYGNRVVSMFINKIMTRGKRSTAERIVYDALEQVEQQARRSAIEVFEEAVRNVTPMVEVKPRRVGGATYQVPVDIRPDRRMALALRWLLQSSRARKGRTMAERLAGELLDAANNQGTTIKLKQDTHRMAEANRAFAHYRW
jgi:small subunit ribosomal protein S7